MIYKTLTGQFALFFLPLDKWSKIFFNKIRHLGHKIDLVRDIV